MIKPKKLTREEKNLLVANVQAYFLDERDEEIGNLAAEQLLDFMLQELYPYIYNQAISDARVMINKKFAQIEDELYTLERPLNNR